MKVITPLARTALGLVFVVFSANYFVPFLPPHTPSPEQLAFIGPFAGTGMLTLIKVVELIAGLALLANRATPLALALLAPIIVGITGFHAALAPEGMPLAIALVVLELVTAWSYRSAFAPMLRLRVAADPIKPATDRSVDRSHLRAA